MRPEIPTIRPGSKGYVTRPSPAASTALSGGASVENYSYYYDYGPRRTNRPGRPHSPAKEDFLIVSGKMSKIDLLSKTSNIHML